LKKTPESAPVGCLGRHLRNEFTVPSDKILGRGTKKNITRIRWKRREILHAVLLTLLLLLFSIFLAVWFEVHHFD